MRSTSVYLSHLGSLMGVIVILNQVIPNHIWDKLSRKMNDITLWFLPEDASLSIPEFIRYDTNEIYDLVDNYVARLNEASRKNAANRIQLTRVKNASRPSRNLAENGQVEDQFKGATFRWSLYVSDPVASNRRVNGSNMIHRFGQLERSYVVHVDKRYKYTLLPEYMEEVLKQGELLLRQNQDRQLFTNMGESFGWEGRKLWSSVPFKHASTFSSLALEPELKDKIIKDLDSFMAGRSFFDRIGRAWKRGYLLYGPPGTGKSSLIAAIANYTQYDVYDLELTEVRSNADLRKLLMGISDKAIIVIEDIDCSVELKKRGKAAPMKAGNDEEVLDDKVGEMDKRRSEESSRVTLSGLLNFVDGLWSCSGSERIIIFTTNHKEDLDQALLRYGRMDLHVSMGYCGFEAFKTLAWTHLGVSCADKDFQSEFGELEELIGKVEVTPAEVAEAMIQNRNDPRAALEGVIVALKKKKREAEEK